MTAEVRPVRLEGVRWLALTGLAFVAFFVLAIVLYGSGAGSEPSQIVAYYASTANRMRQVGGFASLLVGCVLLSAYVGVLTRQVVGDKSLAMVAIASGVGSALLLAVGNGLWAASAFTVELESGYRTNPQAHLLVEDAAFVVVVSAMAIAIPFVAVISLAASASRQFPGWFSVLGFIAIVGLAAAYWYFPLFAFLVWIASGSLLLSRRPVASATDRDEMPSGSTVGR
ncbi:MAG TPA: hypothetical protein VH108_01330 [Gaiellaceae bacterium]|nr:hypothetical protein [Gaiellaceae bacterium]